jgi:serine kinase of HPr protein (carbohydrate metabolism regulator)
VAVTNDEAFYFARDELLNGSHPDEVIGDLEIRGFSIPEAEELMKQATFKLKRLQIMISEETLRKLTKEAKQADMTLSAYVRSLLTQPRLPFT